MSSLLDKVRASIFLIKLKIAFKNHYRSLREMCLYLKFFWSAAFSRIRSENTDQKNSKYGHFSRSWYLSHKWKRWKILKWNNILIWNQVQNGSRVKNWVYFSIPKGHHAFSSFFDLFFSIDFVEECVLDCFSYG